MNKKELVELILNDKKNTVFTTPEQVLSVLEVLDNHDFDLIKKTTIKNNNEKRVGFKKVNIRKMLHEK